MTETGWKYTGDEPMFVTRDAMEQATARFEREIAEAMAKGEHYYLAIVGYKIDPAERELIALDSSSLRVIPSVGCFICEQPVRKGMPEECPGEPVG